MNPKIRLIAADVDGTLVDSQKRVPDGFYEAVRRLHEHGIVFVIASGRQHYNVEKTFAEIKDVVSILSENGAMLIDERGAFYKSEIPLEAMTEMLDAARSVPTSHTLLCGVKSIYTLPCSESCLRDIEKYYERRVVAENAYELAAEDSICKIAFYDSESSEKNLYPVMKRFADKYNPNLSGEHWLDIMNKGIDKGSGLKILLEKFGVKPEECMAFGDFDNDIGMLKICGESYAMENATATVKAVCKHIAPSNDDAGVLQILKREFPFLA